MTTKKHAWGILAAPESIFEAHTQSYLASLAAHEAVNIRGICCGEERITKQMASQYHTAAHAHYEDLVIEKSVDIMYIATPPPTRASLAKACLNYKKSVVIEAPIAQDASAESVYRRADEKNLLAMEAMPMCFLPSIGRLKKMVTGKETGKIVSLHAEASTQHATSANTTANPHKEGIFLTHGRYPLALASALLGPPSRVAGCVARDTDGTITQYAFTAVHQEDILSSLCASRLADGYNQAIINGTKKRIHVGYPFYGRSVITLFQQQKNVGFLDFSYRERLCDHLVEEVHRCITEGQPESPRWTRQNSKDFAQTLQICLAHAAQDHE